MSWYCLEASLFIGLSLANTSLAERMDLSISFMNSDSNSWATLRMLPALSRAEPVFIADRRLRSV